MTRRIRPAPCRGFAVPLSFPDVDPDELAREAAAERRDAAAQDGWRNQLRRVALPSKPDASRRRGVRV